MSRPPASPPPASPPPASPPPGALPDTDALPLRITACGDPVLRRRADPVDPADLHAPWLQRLIAHMRQTMYDAPGVGLAAPQVGVPLQLAVVEDGPDRWGPATPEQLAARERTPLPFTVLVNPQVEPAGEELASFYEGCLSVPGLTGIVPRHRTVRLRCLNERGQPVDHVLSGWPARIVQHETDHLHGTLYLDKVITRSLATIDSYARHWAAGPPAAAAQALGFTLP